MTGFIWSSSSRGEVSMDAYAFPSYEGDVETFTSTRDKVWGSISLSLLSLDSGRVGTAGQKHLCTLPRAPRCFPTKSA